MLATKVSRAAQRASNVSAIVTGCPSAAPITTQCLAYRPAKLSGHQRRESSSKASSSRDGNTSGEPAANVSSKNSDPADQSQQNPAKTSKKMGRHRRTQAAAKGQQQSQQHLPLGKNKETVVDHSPLSKSKEVAVDQFASLPSVPGWYHVPEKDFRISSFFSLHRPISATPGQIPPPSTTEAFAQIFEVLPQVDAWENGNSAEGRPEAVIYTLRNTVERLENAAAAVDNRGMRWEVIDDSGISHGAPGGHMDRGAGMLQGGFGQGRVKTFDELVESFRPFKAPPPPEPFPHGIKSGSAQMEKMQREKLARQVRSQAKRARMLQAQQQQSQQEQEQEQQQQEVKHETYDLNTRLTRSTYPNGQSTLALSIGPLVRVPDADLPDEKSVEQTQQHATEKLTAPTPRRRAHLPFLARMQRRQRQTIRTLMDRSRTGPRPANGSRKTPARLRMLLISVRRQRKLKMKKHKYKKLMKRTRNLRRRQDRL